MASDTRQATIANLILMRTGAICTLLDHGLHDISVNVSHQSLYKI